MLQFFLFAVMHHLSESDNIPPSPISPLAPPLPEGAVVASEKRMVIVKPTRSIDGSQSRLNSVEIESTPRHKVYHKVLVCHLSANNSMYNMFLYQLSSSSSTSSCDEIRGELKLGLIYDINAGILTVKLIEVISIIFYNCQIYKSALFLLLLSL